MDGRSGPLGSLEPRSFKQFFDDAPVALLVIRAEGLVMVHANQPYLDQVQMDLADLVGRHVFDVFPESPDNDDDQTGALERIMTTAIRERRTAVVEGLRYDIPMGDGFEVRIWNAQDVPIFDSEGGVEFLLHYSEDVTALHRARREAETAESERDRVTGLVRLLAELALDLTSVGDRADLERIVVSRTLSGIGAQGGGVVSRDDDGGWRVAASGSLPPDIRDRYARLPFDSPIPAAVCARRGQPVWLEDRAAAVAASPAMAEIVDGSGREAWACLPLTVAERRLGALVVSWVDPHQVTDGERELLEGVAAQCALALDRIERAEAQEVTAHQLQTLAESLQSAMMPTPPRVAGLELAVRYRSAADVAKVGGDWYDAFVQPDGAVMVTVGDVVGHDHIAAGKMGQISGLLRALAFDDADRPHGVDPVATLRRYEQVAGALGVGELATVVLARVEADGRGRVVRWSNAGSPPPVLAEADGAVRLLDDKPDLMLGVEEGAERSEHIVHLDPGATLLLYTDGLVERRDASIADGIDALCEAMHDAADLPLEQLCDRVLDRLAPHIGEDDVAMLAVRPKG